LTGWLLALSLPPWSPWWIGVVGSVIAIGIGKQVFGGLGQNPFNPAMVARAALLISFPVPMTRFVAPELAIGSPGITFPSIGFAEGMAITFGFRSGPELDALSAATALGSLKTALSQGESALAMAWHNLDPLAMTTGTMGGSLGETSAGLLALGGLFLLWRRVITWHIPVAMLGTIAALAALAHGVTPTRHADALFHLLTGATVLGAFFIATDPVSAPVTPIGRLVYGAGCGALTWIIRSFAGYPEGLAFAILLMNASTPLIDRYIRPRVHGRTRRGTPIPLSKKE
jgi:electron transport complex protein RnfD